MNEKVHLQNLRVGLMPSHFYVIAEVVTARAVIDLICTSVLARDR
jgi:hypothetical protein